MRQLSYSSAASPGHALNGNDQHAPQRPIQCRRYLLFLRKWWWIPGLTALIGAGLQAFLLSREPDQYASVARMWVSGKLQLPEGRLYQEEVQNFFGTQIALMQGGRVVERAHAVARAARPDRQQIPVETRINPLPRTSILVLQAIGPDPEYVQLFLNALMEEYTKAKKNFRQKTTEEALAAANFDLSARQGELAVEQQKLEKLKKENDIVVLQAQGDAAGSRLSQLSIQREDLTRELLLLNSASRLEQSLDLKGASSNSAPILTNLMAQFDAAGQNSRAAQEPSTRSSPLRP
jgi:hypothetical protein